MNETIFDSSKEIYYYYNLSLEDSISLLRDKSHYLDTIKDEDIKQIKLSYYKDVFVLMNDGTLYKNGELLFKDVKSLGLSDGSMYYAIRENNIINLIYHAGKEQDYVNANDYSYKKIISTPLGLVLLTNSNEVKVKGTIVEMSIDYRKFFNVDDIAIYKPDSNDEFYEVVVKKDNQVLNLFNNEDVDVSKVIWNDISEPECIEVFSK